MDLVPGDDHSALDDLRGTEKTRHATTHNRRVIPVAEGRETSRPRTDWVHSQGTI